MLLVVVEVVHDLIGLARVLPDYGYWYARSSWGMSDREIKVNAVCVLAALAISPFMPSGSHGAQAAVIYPMQRFSIWLHRERWWYVARVVVLMVTLVYVAFSLISTAPTVFGQRYNGEQTFGESNRELADHNARIMAMEQWRRDVERESLPARLMYIEKTVTQMADDQRSLTRLVWSTLVGVAIWLIQQLFQLLMRKDR